MGAKPAPADSHALGTFGKLIASYFGSVEFANLKPSSRTAYHFALDPIAKEHGHRLVRDMPRDKARKIIETIGATRPGMANLVAAAIKRVMHYEVETGWRNDNPLSGIKRYKLGTHHTWTDAELETYEVRWPLGTRQRLAEDDATAKQIAAISGHRSLKEIERYTAADDQEMLARSAITKLRDRTK